MPQPVQYLLVSSARAVPEVRLGMISHSHHAQRHGHAEETKETRLATGQRTVFTPGGGKKAPVERGLRFVPVGRSALCGPLRQIE